MKRILVEINDESYGHFIDLVSTLPKDKIHLWEAVDRDDFFSEEDNKAYEKALKELRLGQAISLDDFRNERLKELLFMLSQEKSLGNVWDNQYDEFLKEVKEKFCGLL